MTSASGTNDVQLTVEMPQEMAAYLCGLADRIEEQGKGAIGISEITRAVVNALLLDKEINVSGVKTEEQLTQRIRDYWEAWD